jgi:hypothetical protein
MKSDYVKKSIQTSMDAPHQDRGRSDHFEGRSSTADKSPKRSHPLYWAAWYLVNSLLIIAILLVIYATGWEYSTRRYLRGFSDAIVPATAPPDEKIEAILNWMAHGPARLTADPNDFAQDRNPTDTLNYDALLKVCGTATNAFINLIDSGGMVARRLLLLDSNQMTRHVVAEVLVNGQWIVVDPAYRVLFRGPNGKPLTRNDLKDPATFSVATQQIPGYDPNYTFDHTAQIRLARLRFFGSGLREIFNHLRPNWESSTIITLLLERESFAAMILASLLAFLLIIFRISLRWYGRSTLGIHHVRVRRQLLRAYDAFFRTPGQV